MPEKRLQLRDVWRTCNKIRAATFRAGLDLWDLYRPLDPNNNSLISESKFVSVLNGRLKEEIGLSESEILDLAEYFRVHDGRILYTQFCQVIHDSVKDLSKNPPLVTGLEWEDQFHVNALSPSEERRLKLLLTKIAVSVNARDLVLRPYFQDYELVAKNTGAVTIAHFARVLHFLNILVSPDDFNLLLKKYLKDSYTVNYIAFLAALDHYTRTMDQMGILDLGGSLVPVFPPRCINAELPKLPRPEIGNVDAASVFGMQKTFHPILEKPRVDEDLITIIRRIQAFVLAERVRMTEFFPSFDPLNCGRVTCEQFRRVLATMGISCGKRLYLSEPEILILTAQYKDPNDHARVCWRVFCDDIDHVFTVKGLEKAPSYRVEAPPREVVELPRKGATPWTYTDPNLRDFCEVTLEAVKQKIVRRGLFVRPIFNNFDKSKNGHVSRSEFRQCLVTSGILLSDEELFALEQRYLNDMGFNYFWFLKEVEPKKTEAPLYEEYVKLLKAVNSSEKQENPKRKVSDIVQILAKIKGKIARERIRVMEFLREHDRHNEGCITRENFCRALKTSSLELTSTELATLMDVFGMMHRPGWIDYRRFSDTVEEVFTQGCLERAPLITPLQHIPIADGEHNFLNYEERHILSNALKKLAAPPYGELMLVYRDYDRQNCGTVCKELFLRGLASQDLHQRISARELEVVEKCFCVERGLREEVDYRSFLDVLQAIRVTSQPKPV